jgi:hypothetical protein
MKRFSSPTNPSTSSKKPEEVDLKYGDEGFQTFKVMWIYVIVLQESQRVTELPFEAGKHALAEGSCFYFILTFSGPARLRRKVGKFVQFSTMFVPSPSRQTFSGLCTSRKFGAIRSIDANLTVNFQDVEEVGVTLPLRKVTDVSYDWDDTVF